MDSCCVSIFVNSSSIPAGFPISKLVRSGVYLDLPSSFQLRLSKVLEELSDISKIRIEGALGFNIPSTPLNDLVFRPFIMPNKLDAASAPVNVYIYIGSRILPNTRMYVVGYKNGEYDCEIRVSDEHWIVGAKNLKLSSIDLGADFTLNNANVQSFNNLEGYVDGTQGIRFPLAFYGKWHSGMPVIKTINFRPYYSLLWMLQKGACQLGWSFSSPVFESDWGRRLICYLIADDFFKDSTTLDERKFSARRQSGDLPTSFFPSPSWFFGSPIKFSEEIFDNGGHFNNDSNYSGAGLHDFYVTFKVQFGYDTAAQAAQALVFASSIWTATTILELFEERMKLQVLLKYSSSALGYDLLVDDKVVSFREFENVEALGGGLYYSADISVVFKDIQIDPTDYVYVSVGGDSSDGLQIVSFFNLLGGSTFRNEPKQVFLQDGDEFTFQSLLGTKRTFLDLLKGAAHLVGGKFYTDNNKKELWLFPSYNVTIYDDEVVEGYFKEEESQDLDEKLVCDSEEVTTPSARENRYKSFRFKEGDDYEIEALNIKDNESFLGHTVDYGDAYKEEYDISENPFFYATANKLTDGVSPFSGILVDIPHMNKSFDADTPVMEYDIDPRILYWAEPLGQQYINDTVLLNLYGSGSTEAIPYAYMYPNAKTQGGGSFTGGIAYGYQGIAAPTQYIIDNNLYKFFWQRWLNETDINFNIGMLLMLDSKDYFAVDFRRMYSFSFLGRTVFGRLSEVNDYATCDATSTPVSLLPARQSLAACLVTPPDVGVNPCSTNAPVLVITKVGTTYNFSIGGVNTSAVTSIVFQWRYVGASLWINATSVASPTGAFEVRMVVTYADGCPPITRNRLVDACGNAPSFSFAYNNDNSCFTITTSGVVSSPIDSIIIDYSENGGLTWLPYVGCQASVAPLITVRVSWNFTDGCTKVTIINSYAVTPPSPSCTGTTASAYCTTVGTVIRTGTVTGSVALDIIEWREVGDAVWLIWDEATTLPCPIEIRRVIFFCNDTCPTYCSETIACTCAPCAVVVTIASVIQGDLSYNLTANTTGCVSPVYDWQFDGGSGFTSLGLTTQTINAAISGDYKVLVTCALSCSGNSTINIVTTCALPLGNAVNIEVCNDL